MAHTPGPWERIGSMDEDGECRVRQTSSVKHGAGFYSEITICEEVQRVDDARLIAAAPELLAELQYVANMITADEAELISYRRIAAVIAKATGAA